MLASYNHVPSIFRLRNALGKIFNRIEYSFLFVVWSPQGWGIVIDLTPVHEQQKLLIILQALTTLNGEQGTYMISCPTLLSASEPGARISSDSRVRHISGVAVNLEELHGV